MDTQEIKIRLATRKDAELIAALSRKTFFDTFAPHNSKSDMDIFLNEQFTNDALIREVGVPLNTFYLAYHGDEPAGYIKLRTSQSPKELKQYSTLEIARLYASQSMIGKGVGKVLMQRAIDFAAQLHKQVIWLAVWEKNRRAYEFYTKWGFETFGKQVFLLGSDLQNDWLMMKYVL